MTNSEKLLVIAQAANAVMMLENASDDAKSYSKFIIYVVNDMSFMPVEVWLKALEKS